MKKVTRPIKMDALGMDVPVFYTRNEKIRYPMHPAEYWGERGTKLGSGAYGTVWRYKSPTGKFVAIKVFKKEPNGDVSIDSIREISILRRCRHPNIIKVVDIGGYDSTKHSTSLFVVLEMAQMDLGRLINSTSRLYNMKYPNHEFLRSYMYQLARGLHYLHSNDIVHLDLKPSNILIFDNGARLVIADFGFSKAGIIPGQLESRAQTIWWRSPELLLGSYGQMKSLDVFSLGVIYLDMALNRFVFSTNSEDGEEKVVLMKQIELLGHMTEEDWPGVSGFRKYAPDIEVYAKYHMDGNLKHVIMAEAPYQWELGPGFITMISRMTLPNPSRRATIESIVKNTYFTETYDVKSAVEAKMPVITNVDVKVPYCGEYMDPTLFANPPVGLISDALSRKESMFISDWYSEIKTKYKQDMSINTIFHARYLFEYVLSLKPDIRKEIIQLLAGVCLYISSKLIDGNSASTSDISMRYLLNKMTIPYSLYDFLTMELDILKTVNFDLLFPTPPQYLHYILINSTDRIRILSKNIAWLMSVAEYPNMDARKISYVSVYIIYQCSDDEFPKCMGSGGYDYKNAADSAIDQIKYIRSRPELRSSNFLASNAQLAHIIDKWGVCREKKQSIFEKSNSFTFMWYDENTDEELSLELSYTVLEFIRKLGWRLDEKIGQGGENAVFSATNITGKTTKAAILIGNSCKDSDTHSLERIRKLQESGVLSTDYMMIVYEPIRFQGKLSLNPRYCSYTKEQIKYIGVVELTGITLAEAVYLKRSNTIDEKHEFVVNTYRQLMRLFEYLAAAGFEYPDRLLDNFAYRGSDLIFIDLEGMKPAEFPPSPIDIVTEIIQAILNVFDPDEFLRFHKHTSWKGVTGIARDEQESRDLRLTVGQSLGIVLV